VKKFCADLLIAFFIFGTVGGSAQAAMMQTPGDVYEVAGRLTGFALLVAGLYFSVRWRIKLSGHDYRVGRQTLATMLCWYAIVAAFIGLMMPYYARNTFGFTYAAVMVLLWGGVAYACKRWQRRLRAEERKRWSEATAAMPAELESQL
jgi:hypothetical protein